MLHVQSGWVWVRGKISASCCHGTQADSASPEIYHYHLSDRPESFLLTHSNPPSLTHWGVIIHDIFRATRELFSVFHLLYIKTFINVFVTCYMDACVNARQQLWFLPGNPFRSCSWACSVYIHRNTKYGEDKTLSSGVEAAWGHRASVGLAAYSSGSESRLCLLLPVWLWYVISALWASFSFIIKESV